MSRTPNDAYNRQIIEESSIKLGYVLDNRFDPNFKHNGETVLSKTLPKSNIAEYILVMNPNLDTIVEIHGHKRTIKNYIDNERPHLKFFIAASVLELLNHFSILDGFFELLPHILKRGTMIEFSDLLRVPYSDMVTNAIIRHINGMKLTEGDSLTIINNFTRYEGRADNIKIVSSILTILIPHIVAKSTTDVLKWAIDHGAKPKLGSEKFSHAEIVQLALNTGKFDMLPLLDRKCKHHSMLDIKKYNAIYKALSDDALASVEKTTEYSKSIADRIDDLSRTFSDLDNEIHIYACNEVSDKLKNNSYAYGLYLQSVKQAEDKLRTFILAVKSAKMTL